MRRITLVLDNEAEDALMYLKEKAAEAARKAGTAFATPSQNAIVLAAIVDAADQAREAPSLVDDPCPECGKQLHPASDGGVGCECGYWFCC